VTEYELARAVLLGRLHEANSLKVRFRKEWQALRSRKERVRDTEAALHPVDVFLNGKELDRAA
jgi:hypothetical protein